MYIGHDYMQLTISCDWHVHLDGPPLHRDIWTTVNIIFTQGGFGTWGAHKVSSGWYVYNLLVARKDFGTTAESVVRKVSRGAIIIAVQMCTAVDPSS